MLKDKMLRLILKSLISYVNTTVIQSKLIKKDLREFGYLSNL